MKFYIEVEEKRKGLVCLDAESIDNAYDKLTNAYFHEWFSLDKSGIQETDFSNVTEQWKDRIDEVLSNKDVQLSIPYTVLHV